MDCPAEVTELDDAEGYRTLLDNLKKEKKPLVWWKCFSSNLLLWIC